MAAHRKAFGESYTGIILAAVVTMLLAPLTARAQCTVTDNSDNPSDTGSLRYCVAQANAATSAYTTTFASSLNGQTITLNLNLWITASVPVTIQGPGANLLTISGEWVIGYSGFSPTATISGLTLTNGPIYNYGTLTVSNCTISGSGAVIENDGGLTLTDGTVTGPGTYISTDGTAIISNSTISGQGISAYGTLSVDHSTISGGPISIGGGTTNVSNSTISGSASGGIVVGPSSQLTVSNTTISGNSNWGIYADNATLTVDSTIISANTGTSSVASGIYYYSNTGTANVSNSSISGNSGGGIVLGGSVPLTVSNSTISGNAGPGIFAMSYLSTPALMLTVSDSTVSGNTFLDGAGINASVGTVTLVNSIIAGNINTAFWAYGIDCIGCAGQSPYNLISTQSPPIDPQLAPLGNYGGPTQSMLPLPGSPAICAGSSALVPSGLSNDQRGFPRLNTSYTGYSDSTPCVDLGAVQTNYQSVQFPAPDEAYTGIAGAIVDTPSYPVVAVTENGQNIGGVPVTLAVSGSPSVGGLWTENTVSNVGATFSDLIVNSTGDYTLSATLSITPTSSVSISTASSANGNATLDISALGGVSVTSLSFGNQVVGTTSAPQAVTLTNSSGSAVNVSIGTNTNFVETDNCAGSVGAGGSCTINVSFAPTTAGPLTGTLTINETSNGQPAGTATVSLSGTGVAGSGGVGGEGDTPTLPQWAAILMGLALAAVSIFKMRPMKRV